MPFMKEQKRHTLSLINCKNLWMGKEGFHTRITMVSSCYMVWIFTTTNDEGEIKHVQDLQPL